MTSVLEAGNTDFVRFIIKNETRFWASLKEYLEVTYKAIYASYLRRLLKNQKLECTLKVLKRR
jgi:hypothetical protein